MLWIRHRKGQIASMKSSQIDQRASAARRGRFFVRAAFVLLAYVFVVSIFLTWQLYDHEVSDMKSTYKAISGVLFVGFISMIILATKLYPRSGELQEMSTTAAHWWLWVLAALSLWGFKQFTDSVWSMWPAVLISCACGVLSISMLFFQRSRVASDASRG
jgi:hypothetical protein